MLIPTRQGKRTVKELLEENEQLRRENAFIIKDADDARAARQQAENDRHVHERVDHLARHVVELENEAKTTRVTLIVHGFSIALLCYLASNRRL